MLATAKLKHLRIAPRKVRLVAEMIRRKPVKEAQKTLSFTTKKASQVILKLLNQAVANAKTGFQAEEENLYISKILIDEGPKYKRWMPRARGMATPIYKRTSHVTIILDESTKKGRRLSAKRTAKKQEKSDKTTQVTEKDEKTIKTEKPKFKPEREERKPVTEKGIKRIFKRKAF